MSVTDLASPAPAGQGAAPVSPPAAPPPPPAENNSPPSLPAAPPPPPDPFYKSLKNPELRGYAEVKGFKGDDGVAFAETVLDSYRNLEKLRGVPAERLLTTPEDWENPEQVKAFMDKLPATFRAPEKPEAYGFDTIDGVEPGRAKALQALAHKHGVPQAMASAFFNDLLAADKAELEAQDAAHKEEVGAELGRLQAKWGKDYDANMEAAKRAARRFGFTDEDVATLEQNVGVAGVFERLHAIGGALSEAGFVGGDKKDGGYAMTADGARTERDRLMTDKDFLAKYTDGDKAAAERIERLNRIIAGGKAMGAN